MKEQSNMPIEKYRSESLRNGKKDTNVPLSAPKRPMNAYNFFYQSERLKLLGIDVKKANTDLIINGYIVKKRRPHRRSHGKMSLTELSKHIADSWKRLSHQEKEQYQELAKKDSARYKKDLQTYTCLIKTSYSHVSVSQPIGRMDFDSISLSAALNYCNRRAILLKGDCCSCQKIDLDFFCSMCPLFATNLRAKSELNTQQKLEDEPEDFTLEPTPLKVMATYSIEVLEASMKQIERFI